MSRDGPKNTSSNYTGTGAGIITGVLYYVAIHDLPESRHKKKCQKCGEFKEKSDFHNNYRTASGKVSYCKKCLGFKGTGAIKHSALTDQEYLVIRALKNIYRYKPREIVLIFDGLDPKEVGKISSYATRKNICPYLMPYEDLCKPYIEKLDTILSHR